MKLSAILCSTSLSHLCHINTVTGMQKGSTVVTSDFEPFQIIHRSAQTHAEQVWHSQTMQHLTCSLRDSATQMLEIKPFTHQARFRGYWQKLKQLFRWRKDSGLKCTLTAVMVFVLFFPLLYVKSAVQCYKHPQLPNGKCYSFMVKNKQKTKKMLLFYILLMSGMFYLLLDFIEKFQKLSVFQKFERSVTQSKLKQILT